LAPGKNLADAKNLALPKSQADGKNLAPGKNLADAKNLAPGLSGPADEHVLILVDVESHKSRALKNHPLLEDYMYAVQHQQGGERAHQRDQREVSSCRFRRA
jgi:hypothetical protein